MLKPDPPEFATNVSVAALIEGNAGMELVAYTYMKVHGYDD